MITEPIFFERNRVRRIYTGGKLFGDFFGDEPTDGYFPEEWIASQVKAMNKVKADKHEGVSKIKNSDMYFDELLEKHPEEMLGKSGKMRILVKALDSAIRLPAQAHPDKAFSKKYFNSEYGKTESWIVLATRPNAKIYFGFKDSVTKEDFCAAIEASRTSPKAMEDLMEYITPQIGDVFLVPAKTVHAIGAGCLVLEVQEPTDFTIQPEYLCGEYGLTEKEMYIGLSKSDAIKCFNFEKTPDTKLTPKTVSDSNGVKFENLITPKDTDCFVINRITLSGGSHTVNAGDSYGVYIVTNGFGKLVGKDYVQSIKKGSYFFMPHTLMNRFSLEGESLEVIECY